MNTYFLRINGKVLKEALTYQTIEAKGLLSSQNGDKVEVRASTERYYKPISNYSFPERNQTSASKGYYIDEYGQMHRSSASGTTSVSSQRNSSSVSTSTYKPHTTSSYSSSTTSSTRSNTTSSNTSSESDDILWGILFFIGVAIVGGIAGYFVYEHDVISVIIGAIIAEVLFFNVFD